jgi:hypothetical protein
MLPAHLEFGFAQSQGIISQSRTTAPASSTSMNTTNQDRRDGARLADVVDQHIRWRLWHGQVPRALDLIGDTLGALDGMARSKSSVAAVAGKVANTLRALETYVSGQAELIIDYATA